MKILITGATGNVGRALKKYLIKNDCDILCLTRKAKKSPKEIKGDLTKYFSLLNATKNIDVVIHLAAAIKGRRKLLNKINVQGTKNLINACEKNKVSKIIFISSLDTNFKTPYGISKLKAEEIIRKSKLKYIILRPGTIYGEGFKTGINTLIKIIKKTLFIPVIGSGKNLYQPIYVGDLNSLIKQIINKNKFNNKTYFIGGKEKISMNDLINLISFNFNKKIIKIHLPQSLSKIILKSKNFELDKVIDNKPIKKDFNFNPISISEGIKKIL